MDQRRRIEELVDYWTPLALRLCVERGVLDQFGHEARSCAEVAEAIGADARTVTRLVRALEGSGVFEAVEGDRYRLSELGCRLLRDEPGSLAGLASFKPWEIHAWAEAGYTLATGKPAFDVHFGHGLWTHLQQQPELAARFDEQMQRRTASLLDLGLEAYDWPERGTVVDIGGGNGELLRRLLVHCPELRGVLFDLPHVVERAGALCRDAGVYDRIELVGGDMFTDPLPEAGDVYVLASVLHDWDDDDAHRVLVRCREAMPSGARLVLFESVLAEGPGWDLGKLVDLHMLVLFGAGERTEREWDDLLTRSGFSMARVVLTPGLTWIEAVPAASDR